MSLGPFTILQGAAAGWMLLATVLLGGVIIRAEWRSRGPRRRIRVAATAVATLSLLVIGVRPQWRWSGRQAAPLLITPGASPAQVRALLDSLAPQQIFRLPGVDLQIDGSAPLPDVGYLLRHDPGLGALEVVGWGLTAAETAALGAVPLHLHPSPPPRGVAQVSWMRQVELGNQVSVRGTVIGAAGGWAYLEDPAGPADSVKLAGDTATFALSALPRAVGRWRYVLRIASPAPVAAETLGVSVVVPTAPRVLVLASSPSFETKYLKRWLGRLGGSVVVRTAVSRGRYHTEFVNAQRRELKRISSDLLSSVDAVLLDHASLDRLSEGERAALAEAVSRDGLGVLVTRPIEARLQRGRTARPLLLGFAADDHTNLDQRTVRPTWQGGPPRLRTEIPAEPFGLAEGFGAEVLVRDQSGRILVQAKPRGAGMVVVSVLSFPATWVLAGEHAVYASYWSLLFSRLIGRREPQRWAAFPAEGPMFVHQPIRLEALSGGVDSLGFVHTAGVSDTVFLAPGPDLDGRRLATFWPRRTGWHQVGPAAFWLYVQAPTQWKSWQAAERLRETGRLAAMNAGRESRGDGGQGERSRPVSLGWLFGAFLSAVTCLWAMQAPRQRK